MILSICICSIPKRYVMLSRLLQRLYEQINLQGAENEVEILVNDSLALTTGAKRKLLYDQAVGKYICSIDDDDDVYPYYVSEILKAVESDPDAIAINGIMTIDGKDEHKWFISKVLPYTAMKRFDRSIVYARYQNHLAPVRATIARAISFPDTSKFEDFDFAKRLNESGLIKTETIIGTQLREWMQVSMRGLEPSKPMYIYKYLNNK